MSDERPAAADEGHLFCFGLGYSAHSLARRLLAGSWRVSGTYRTEDSRPALTDLGAQLVRFDRHHPLADAAAMLAEVTHVLSSVPPDELGDPVLDVHGPHLTAAHHLRWIGYLSTTGVYGDTGGAVVDEEAPLKPSSERGRRRVAAETGWLDLARRHRLPVHVFRLAGIYGPGRSALDQVRSGRARRIDRPGHLFSRIHVDDIAHVLEASMARPDPGRIYNVCDDLAAEPSAVIAHASVLLGREPPPLVPFAQAAAAMSPMALSFWQDDRLVDNGRIKRELDVVLAHPDYRSGLAAVLAAEEPGTDQDLGRSDGRPNAS
jgi:nucleoside-diphosphate-sugar epimerase